MSKRKPIILAPGKGRKYKMGRMSAVFKADNAETAGTYSVSEWWLEPRTRGPGTHQHSDDHVYYVLAGTLSACLNGKWVHCKKGSYLLIPGGTSHDFENRGRVRTGFITFNNEAGFENDMPAIVGWFKKTPPARITRSKRS